MRALICALCAVFAVLLGLTFYVAGKANDGLVDEDYYGKASSYLSAKEREESIGLTIRVPDRLTTGPGRLRAEIATAEGPLPGARASLRAMRLSGPEHDRTFPLREEGTGVYAADVDFPEAGSWMLCLSVESNAVKAERRWIAVAVPDDPPPAARRNIHAEPVTAYAGGRAVILDISPKPVSAMKELVFTVEFPGYDGPGVPFLDLDMPGMRMPPNRVILSREAGGRFRGKGVIVRCRSGKRTWTATVTLPGGDRAVFAFDIVP